MVYVGDDFLIGRWRGDSSKGSEAWQDREGKAEYVVYMLGILQ